MVTKLRLIGIGLLLAVFFLPLHGHAADAHLTKECSCIHGSRTQMGPLPVHVSSAPDHRSEFVTIDEPRLYVWRGVTRQSIRAPPSTSSL